MFHWTGQKLGNYQVLHLLGQGGFADVYLGQHIYLQTYAAIKVLQARLGPDDLQTFLREAQVVVSLVHPHIIRILEFGEEGRVPYLVMDYCPGGTLRQRHPKGTRVSLYECADYIEQVAQALFHAHSLKIIHRDIKPENILIGKNGALLLSDFGIAITSQSSRYSHRQNISGTVAYSAPEQLQGKATLASDQYSLAIVAYEWLCGELPYKGSFSEIASQHVLAPIPPINNKVPSLPDAVEQVLIKALAKDHHQRFKSVLDFATAFKQATQDKLDPTVLLTPLDGHATDSSTYVKTIAAAPLTTSTPTKTQLAPPYTLLPGSHEGPAKKPATRQKIKPAITITILILILTLTTISARMLLFPPADDTQHTGTSTQTASQGQATPPPTLTLLPTPTSSPTPTPTPTATPTPTPTPQVVNVNRQMQCIQTIGSNCALTITITSFRIDKAQRQTEMLLSIDAEQDCNGFFSSLSMQDSRRQTYKPTGDTISFSVGNGQTLKLTAIYKFIAQPGELYTLYVSPLCYADAYSHQYASTQFTF